MNPATHRPEHFLWDFENGVGTVTLLSYGLRLWIAPK